MKKRYLLSLLLTIMVLLCLLLVAPLEGYEVKGATYAHGYSHSEPVPEE